MTNVEYELLAQSRAYDNFVAVPIHWAKKIGFLEAGILQIFISKHKYFKEQQKLIDGRFYLTADTIEEICGASKDQQRTVMNKLKKHGFINVQKRGMPAKNFYLLDHKKIVETLDLSKSLDIAPQEVQNPTTSSVNSHNMLVDIAPHVVQNPPQLNKVLHQISNTNQSIIIPSETSEGLVPAPPRTELTKLDDDDAVWESQAIRDLQSQVTDAPTAELLALIVDIVQGIQTAPSGSCFKVGGTLVTQTLIKTQLDKLRKEHIQYVIHTFKSLLDPITNPRAYLLTMLYNAPSDLATSNHQQRTLSSSTKKSKFNNFSAKPMNHDILENIGLGLLTQTEESGHEAS